MTRLLLILASVSSFGVALAESRSIEVARVPNVVWTGLTDSRVKAHKPSGEVWIDVIVQEGAAFTDSPVTRFTELGYQALELSSDRSTVEVYQNGRKVGDCGKFIESSGTLKKCKVVASFEKQAEDRFGRRALDLVVRVEWKKKYNVDGTEAR